MQIAALLPAAGLSSRLGDPARHKLLARIEGETLIRRAARRALEAGFDEVVVVTGARHTEMEAALRDLPVRLCHNEDFAQGMAGSLQRGRDALTAPGPEGLIILLPDMPLVTVDHLHALAQAFRQAEGRRVVRATADGRPGNPVILPRALYQRFDTLSGDAGARQLIRAAEVAAVEIGAAAFADADTPEALAALGASFD